MNRLLNLAQPLRDLAEDGTGSDVHHALELCFAFMERIEQDRLISTQSSVAMREPVPHPSSPFVN